MTYLKGVDALCKEEKRRRRSYPKDWEKKEVKGCGIEPSPAKKRQRMGANIASSCVTGSRPEEP